MKGSVIVVGFFVLGVLAGRSGSMPAWVLNSTTSFVALCALLLWQHDGHLVVPRLSVGSGSVLLG